MGKKQFSADTTEREVRNYLLRGNISTDGGEEEKAKEVAEKAATVEPIRYSVYEKSVSNVCIMFQPELVHVTESNSFFLQVFDVEWEPHSMDILLTDPPYGVLNIERDAFSPKQMADFAALAKKVMKPNG